MKIMLTWLLASLFLPIWANAQSVTIETALFSRAPGGFTAGSTVYKESYSATVNCMNILNSGKSGFISPFGSGYGRAVPLQVNEFVDPWKVLRSNNFPSKDGVAMPGASNPEYGREVGFAFRMTATSGTFLMANVEEKIVLTCGLGPVHSTFIDRTANRSPDHYIGWTSSGTDGVWNTADDVVATNIMTQPLKRLIGIGVSAFVNVDGFVGTSQQKVDRAIKWVRDNNLNVTGCITLYDDKGTSGQGDDTVITTQMKKYHFLPSKPNLPDISIVDGKVVLNVQNPISYFGYSIECSTDLVAWQPVVTVSGSNYGGPLEYALQGSGPRNFCRGRVTIPSP